jgi:hypothetical protein
MMYTFGAEDFGRQGGKGCETQLQQAMTTMLMRILVKGSMLALKGHYSRQHFLIGVFADFKKAGVRVLWTYNPWDTGTTTSK